MLTIKLNADLFTHTVHFQLCQIISLIKHLENYNDFRVSYFFKAVTFLPRSILEIFNMYPTSSLHYWNIYFLDSNCLGYFADGQMISE